MMEIDIRKLDDVIVLDLDGRLVSGVGVDALKQTMDRLVADSWSRIVLNLAEVKRIDSAGIGELMSSVRMAQKLGSTVHLVQVDGQVRRILHLSQLLPLLKVFEDEDAALAAFDGAAQPDAN